MRKRTRPTATSTDVRALTQRQRIELLIDLERARFNAAWSKVDPTMPPADAQSVLATDLPYFGTPAPSGSGRPRNATIDGMARSYIAAVESKDALRADGYQGMPLDNDTLASIARQAVAGWDRLDAERQAKLIERVKDAVKHRRRQKRAR